MIDKPMISIITPVYNVEKYLKRCVLSILQQTYNDFELILIDDGSTDKSGKICDEMQAYDNRVVVVHQKNKGAGAARNAGLEIAKGNYIGFVDSDDWVERKMYEVLINAIKEYPQADMAECETNRVRGENKKSLTNTSTYRTEVKTRKQMLESFFRINGGESNYGIYTKLIKKSVIENFRFVEGTISEDVMASYYFYKNSMNVVTINQKMYNYFQNNKGVTRNKVSRKDLEYITAFKKIEKDVKEFLPELHKYAELNFARANFTILGKIKIYGYDKNDIELKEKIIEMKRVVRSNFRNLLSLKMSFTRKILLLLVCL